MAKLVEPFAQLPPIPVPYFYILPMPVPTYDKFIDPILRYLAGHPDGAPTREVQDAAASAIALSEADRNELLPSGAQYMYKNRVGWAHDRLKRAGYSTSPRRGYWKLTQIGRDFANSHPAPLSAELIEEIATGHDDVILRPLVDANIVPTVVSVTGPSAIPRTVIS